MLINFWVVFAIIAILAAIVIIAINPAKRFRDTNNAKRVANVTTILNAIGTNIVDNKGEFTKDAACDTEVGDITTISKPIGTTAGGGTVDLGKCLIDTYLSKIPVDPNATYNDADTGYTIQETTAGGYTVCAPHTMKDDGSGEVGATPDTCITR